MSQSNSLGGGLVDIVFTLPETVSPEPIVVSIPRPSQPINLNEVHPSAATSNTSFEYSGRHDQGVLPQLKTEGHLANVITAILEAKHQSDTILTKLIEEAIASGETTIGKSKQSKELEDLAEDYFEEQSKRKKAKRNQT